MGKLNLKGKAAGGDDEKPSSAPSWLKRGAAAQQAIDDEREAAEQRQAESDTMWRFWMKGNTDATIVFLDGDLITEGPQEGKLDVVTFREHTTKHKGKWYNVVCTEDAGDPCPLCEADDTPALVAPFTVIDTRKIEGRKKTYENEPKLFIAKQRTIATLQKMAAKRGGLRGCVFEVSRSDDRAARVGDSFDFEGKLDEEQLKENFVTDNEEVIQPADYSKHILYRTPKEIHALFEGELKTSSVGGEGVGDSAGDEDVPF
jgi:hypothetical protein